MKRATLLTLLLATATSTTALAELKLPTSLPTVPTAIPKADKKEIVVTKEMKSLKVAYETFLQEQSNLLQQMATTSEGNNSSATTDWMSQPKHAKAFSDYELRFLNEPNAKVVKPRTAHFIKGPVTYKFYHKVNDLETVSLDFDNPLNYQQMDRLAAQQFEVTTAWEEIKIPSARLDIQNTNLLDMRINNDESRQLGDFDIKKLSKVDASFVFRNTTDRASYDMIFEAQAYDTRNDIVDQRYLDKSCTTVVSANGNEFYRDRGLKFRDTKPFPVGDFKFNVAFECDFDRSGIKTVSVDFINDRGASVGTVSIPYTNRIVRTPTNTKPPVLEKKLVRYDGRTSYGTSDHPLTRVSTFTAAPQSRGITYANHWVDTHYQGKFIPQKAGIYQFAFSTATNLCTQRSSNSCRQYWGSGGALEVNGAAVIIAPRFKSDTQRYDNFGSFEVFPNQVGKPLVFKFSSIPNWGLDNSDNIYALNQKDEAQLVDNLNPAVQYTSLRVREPDAMYFRDFNSDDFAPLDDLAVAAAPKGDATADTSWITGAAEEQTDIIEDDTDSMIEDDFADDSSSLEVSNDDNDWLGNTDEDSLTVETNNNLDALGLGGLSSR